MVFWNELNPAENYFSILIAVVIVVAIEFGYSSFLMRIRADNKPLMLKKIWFLLITKMILFIILSLLTCIYLQINVVLLALSMIVVLVISKIINFFRLLI